MRLPALAFTDRVARHRELGHEVIPVGGVPVLPMPPHVVDAAAKASGEVFGRRTRGTPELRQVLAGLLDRTHRLAVDPDTDLLITHGAQHGMSVALRALLRPGDEVIVPSPTYFFDGMIRMAGAIPRYVCSSERTGWAIDIDGLAAAITSATRAIVLCNPNNPTGNVPTAEELQRVVDLAERHGFIVFSDESYERYVHEGPGYVPLQTMRADPDRLVTVTSLSKNYAFSSWRIGYVHASPRTIEQIHVALEWDAINVGDIPQAAATAVLTGPQDWVDVEFATMRARRDVLLHALDQAGIPCVRPQAGIFAFADLGSLGSGEELENHLLDVGVAALSGGGFHGPETHVRLLYGASMENVKALGERVAATVAAADRRASAEPSG